MASSFASRAQRFLRAGLIGAALALAGCASTGGGSSTPPPSDPWATPAAESSTWSLFSATAWRNFFASFTRDDSAPAPSPYARNATFEVMRLRNPSDVAVIKTVPETVLWQGPAKYSFNVREVQWQKPPPPPPPPPKPPAPPPPPPEPVLLKSPQTVTQTVYFAFAKYALSQDAKDALDALPTDNVVQVLIEAHTDSVGGDAYNDRLSRRRGQAVADYLAKRGIATEVMQVEARGKRDPVADNATAEGRAKNRRAEVNVTVQVKG